MTLDARTTAMFDALYKDAPEFKTVTFVDHAMDQLIHLTTNESYRAQRIDEYLTILWAPNQMRIIGVKIKGFRSLFESFKEEGLLEESQYLPLCSAIAAIMKRFVGEASEERAKWYTAAEETVGNARIGKDTYHLAA